jgi:hypothetical protein
MGAGVVDARALLEADPNLTFDDGAVPLQPDAQASNTDTANCRMVHLPRLRSLLRCSLLQSLVSSELVTYVVLMSVVEHTLSYMLRNSGDVIAEAEHQDVVLRRRDGADLILGLRSREESIRSALGVLARLLVAAGLDPAIRDRVASALTASLPWTSFLPDQERAEFFEALTAKAAACVELDTFEPLARLIDGWRATAEVYGVPELRAKLEVGHTGPPVPIPRPETG